MIKAVTPLLLAVAILIFGNAYAADGIKLYGVGLASTYEEVIQNGIDKGFKVEATIIPEKFKDNPAVKQRSAMAYPHDEFKKIFSWLAAISAFKDKALGGAVNNLDDNLFILRKNGNPAVTLVTYEGNDIPVLTFSFFRPDEAKGGMFAINIDYLTANGSHFSKDLADVFTERYGAPTRGNRTSLGWGFVFFDADYWKVNEEVMILGDNSSIITNPALALSYFKKCQEIIDAEIKRQQDEQKAKDDVDSARRKSMM